MTKHLIFGLHAVESLLSKQPERVLRLCIQQDRQDKKINTLMAAAKRQGLSIEYVSRQALDNMTNEANHQGVVAHCQAMRAYQESDLPVLLKNIPTPPFVLILDGVQDPHNLGACFRTADAAGVHVVIAPKDKSASITPVVSKVASGAAETIPFVQVTNLVRAMEVLKEMGIWIYGAAGEAEQTIYNIDFKGPVAIVMGAEGDGLRRLTREHCDALVKIPMAGSVASLNVSVAAGIFLFEVARTRKISK